MVKKATIICLALLILILILFYYPLWLKGNVALNGNFLVFFYSPWRFEKFEGYPYGVPAKQGGGYDVLRIGYPYFGMIHDGWKNGTMPLWNPYNFAGLPLAAETQSAAFYPLQFLSPFVSQINLWTIFTMSGYFFCFLFTFWYFYYQLKSTVGSIFGSFTFTFNTFFIAWNQEVVTAIHSAMWLPMILLSIDHLLESFSLLWWLLLILASWLSILAGYIQMTFYIFIISLLYAIWQIAKYSQALGAKIKFLCLIISGFAFAIGLSLFQLIPLYEMYSRSSRSIVDMKLTLIQSLMPVFSVIQFVIPEFFGSSGTWNFYGLREGATFYERTFSISLIAMIFAVFGLLVKTRGKNKFFFLLIGIGSFLLTLDLPVSRSIFYTTIPLLSSSVSSRMLFILPFCLSYLATLGICQWYGDTNKAIRTSLIFTLVTFSYVFFRIVNWVLYARYHRIIPEHFVESNWTTIATRNSVLPISILLLSVVLFGIAYVNKRLKPVIVIVFLLINIGQIYYFFQKVTAFSPKQFVYPTHPIFDFLKKDAQLYRFIGVDDASIENNLATQMGVYTAEGYDSLADRRFAQLLKASETNGTWTDQLSRSDVGIYRGKKNELFGNTMYRLRLLELTSTKYIFYKPTKDDLEIPLKLNKLSLPVFKYENEIHGIQIYSFENAIPRALFVPYAITINGEQKIFDTLFDQKFDPRQQIIIEHTSNFTTSPDPSSAVHITEYKPNTITLEVATKTPQWLLLTDSYYPGWHAFVDGKKTEIYQANFALRAIPVTPGKHSVIFTYNPSSLMIGLRLSFLTLLILITITFLLIGRRFSLKATDTL